MSNGWHFAPRKKIVFYNHKNILKVVDSLLPLLKIPLTVHRDSSSGLSRQNQSSSPVAVSWEELTQNGLQGFVDIHGVVFAQVVPAGWAGVHFCLKGSLKAFPADIVLALCGDGLINHFLAANAEKHLFNFVQEFRSK